jgi:hypothetical protein
LTCIYRVESHGWHFQRQGYVCILFRKMQDLTFVVVECIFIEHIFHHWNMLQHYLLVFPHMMHIVIFMFIGIVKIGTKFGGTNKLFVSFQALLFNCKALLINSFSTCIFLLRTMLWPLYVFLFGHFCAHI